jgi:hypothetical protein
MGGRSSAVYSAQKGVAVTPSDATILETTRGLWVGGAGNVAVVFADGGSAVTLSTVGAGTLLPIQVKQVMSTNTTATLITALY